MRVVGNTVRIAKRDGNAALMNSIRSPSRSQRRTKRPTPTGRAEPLVASVRRAVASGVIRGLLARTLKQWATAWGEPELPSRVTLRFNPRLRSTVARWVISTRCLEVGSHFYAPRGDPREVLCHEFAHAAAVSKFGSAIRPHGREWRKLIREAGYEPKAYKRAGQRLRENRGQTLAMLNFEHRCLVCQAVRYGKKAVKRWRCMECAAAGLPGSLAISKLPELSGPQ